MRVALFPGEQALRDLPHGRAPLIASALLKTRPPEIIDRLKREINAGLADPKIKARLAEFGGTALPSSPAEFGKFIADETEKWGNLIRAAKIKPE